MHGIAFQRGMQYADIEHAWNRIGIGRDQVFRCRRHLEPAPMQGHVQRVDHEGRSEEHTSELQSLMRISYAVFCLKKKKYKIVTKNNVQQPDTKQYRHTNNTYHK